MSNRVYLSLGSNVEPERNLPRCIKILAETCQILAVSRVYETAYVGPAAQDNFLNAAVLVETEMGLASLKSEVLLDMENRLGRVRTADKYAARTIDIDISLFNDEVLSLGARHIPDPEILEYAHIALPLADLDAEYRHPETGQTLADIAANFANQSDVQLRADIDLAAGLDL